MSATISTEPSLPGKTSRHRFLPRYAAIAYAAMGVGALLLLCGLLFGAGASRTFGYVAGTIGIGVGIAYLKSPAWAIVVTTDDLGFSVRRGSELRLSVAWNDVVRVVASPATGTCFVDGGSPERSLLVPGPGASAPYDIADKEILYRTILAHVAPDRVEEVALLEAALDNKSADSSVPADRAQG